MKNYKLYSMIILNNSTQYILVLLYSDNHWYLMVIDLQEKIYFYYNSLFKMLYSNIFRLMVSVLIWLIMLSEEHLSYIRCLFVDKLVKKFKDMSVHLDSFHPSIVKKIIKSWSNVLNKRNGKWIMSFNSSNCVIIILIHFILIFVTMIVWYLWWNIWIICWLAKIWNLANKTCYYCLGSKLLMLYWMTVIVLKHLNKLFDNCN